MLLESIFGYLFGSIPFALVVGKLFYKTDIRGFGSGNLGGTNAGRVLGGKAGVAVAILDGLKGFFVIAIVMTFNPSAAVIAGFMAAIGHCYPIFAQFKGGKAVSTAFGYLLGVSLFITHTVLWMFVLPLFTFFAILKLTKFVSLSSLIAVSLAAIISFFVQPNLQVSLCALLIAILVIYRHRANIERLRNHTENKIHWL